MGRNINTGVSINFNYYSNINKVTASEKEQKGHVSNPFLNLMAFSQNYVINWIEARRGFYENAFKAVWDLWLRGVGIELKEMAKVE